MSSNSADIRKKARAGGTATCALALALACAAPGGAAHAEYLPEGSGTFDVSTITEVLPVIDPDALLANVVIHVANDAGEHLEAAQVEVVVVPPNAEDFDPRTLLVEAPEGEPEAEAYVGAEAGSDDPEADPEADPEKPSSHAVVASGATAANGRVLLPDAAVGATYRVSVVKDGHEEFEEEFSCAGSDGEVWEVVLNRIPEPLPPGAEPGSAQGDGAALSDATAAAASASGQIASSEDHLSGILARPVRGFVMLLDDAFPYWLIGLVLLAVALTAGCLGQAHRIRKEDDAREP